MTGPEHYAEAQLLLTMDDIADHERSMLFVAQAQVHAILALAAATAATIPDTSENKNVNLLWHEADAW